MGNPCLEQTSCTLSRKIAGLVCNVHWSSSAMAFFCFKRSPSQISVSITHPQSICYIPPENMGNPCLEQTSCTLSRKIARLVCNVHWSSSVVVGKTDPFCDTVHSVRVRVNIRSLRSLCASSIQWLSRRWPRKGGGGRCWWCFEQVVVSTAVSNDCRSQSYLCNWLLISFTAIVNCFSGVVWTVTLLKLK